MLVKKGGLRVKMVGNREILIRVQDLETALCELRVIMNENKEIIVKLLNGLGNLSNLCNGELKEDEELSDTKKGA